MSTIRLPQYIWHDPREVEFPLPDSWRVTVHNIHGYNQPAMKPAGIRDAIASPMGMRPLREVAKGKRDVVIIFDDMTRSTEVAEIIPFVLQELSAAGITDDKIRFIAAVANHQALDRISLAKKLGDEMVTRFPVYNHCPFMNCTDIGTTSYGTKASINSDVVQADLKIGIGQVLPHVSYGYSGGAKIIVPGVASYDTVTAHHSQTHQTWKEARTRLGLSCMGVVDDNPINADAQEIAKLVGIDMVINCIVNRWGKTVAIFAGSLESAYAAAVSEAKVHYLATNTGDNDIVIANAYIKASEFMIAWTSTKQAVSRDGGDVVVICSSPAGAVVHYLFETFGKSISGSVFRPQVIPAHINRFIIYTEYPEARIMDRFPDREKVVLTSDWGHVIQTLKQSHGSEAKVAVYPSADIQHFA